MSPGEGTQRRKTDHIRINLEEDVRSGQTTGLEDLRLPHEALPELNLEEISLHCSLFGQKIKAPILISSMTGGTDQAETINRHLAEAAQQAGIPMGLGSQRAALENPDLMGSFQVRNAAPDIPLFANLGAVQLNYGMTSEDCRRAVEMIEGDGLILHLNALQEAVQPEGETRFSGLTKKIARVCRDLDVPVIVKEVGWGFSRRSAQLLQEAGVAALDIAGAGGTSWSEVEMHRAKTESQRLTAAAFLHWGIPTAESIQLVRSAAPQLLIFASGGLRTGVDIAKCIALGAALGGMAGPMLKAAAVSSEAVYETIQRLKSELRISMFAAGAGDLQSLSAQELRPSSL